MQTLFFFPNQFAFLVYIKDKLPLSAKYFSQWTLLLKVMGSKGVFK